MRFLFSFGVEYTLINGVHACKLLTLILRLGEKQFTIHYC